MRRRVMGSAVATRLHFRPALGERARGCSVAHGDSSGTDAGLIGCRGEGMVVLLAQRLSGQ